MDFNDPIDCQTSEVGYSLLVVTERLSVDSCLIKKNSTMNLNDGIYQFGGILNNIVCKEICEQSQGHILTLTMGEVPHNGIMFLISCDL